MLFDNVSFNRKIKDGFYQNCFITDRYEILISHIKQGTTLDAHSHDQKQFGYCFEGSFDFVAGDKTISMAPGMSYLVDGDIVHSADANQDFYALDFKFNCDQKENYSLQEDIFRIKGHRGEFEVNVSTFSLATIQKLTPKNENPLMQVTHNSDKQYFLILSEDNNVNCQLEEVKLNKNTVYKLNHSNQIEIKFKEINGEILLIEIENGDVQ